MSLDDAIVLVYNKGNKLTKTVNEQDKKCFKSRTSGFLKISYIFYDDTIIQIRHIPKLNLFHVLK